MTNLTSGFRALFGRSKPKGILPTRASVCEPLEQRRLLTAVFKPIFGDENQLSDGGARLYNPTVYMIYWGSFWNNKTAQINTLQGDVQVMQYSNFGRIVQEYGGPGLGDWTLSSINHVDFSNPANGFVSSKLDAIVISAYNNSPIPNDSSDLYVVVTPPGIKSSSPTAGGYNFYDNSRHEIWVSTAFKGGTSAINDDRFTLILSHEIQESITSPDTNGVEVNPGANWTLGGNGNQIADYEGNSYYFREPNGVLIQPVWSEDYNSWVAYDNNSQNFNLTPNWNGTSFSGTYKLILNGDQESSPNDVITITETSAGGVSAGLNGEWENFDHGVISSIIVNPGAGSNTINIGKCPVAIVVDDTSNDTVNLGSSGSVAGINAGVFLTGTSHNTTLNINDFEDPKQQSITVGSQTVTGMPCGSINFDDTDVANLKLLTGTASNTVYVDDVGQTTTIQTQGPTAFIIGQYVEHDLHLFNGIHDSIEVDLQNNLSDSITLTSTEISGWAAGAIYYNNYVQSLKILGGSNTDTYLIRSTPAGGPTTIDGGLGESDITVQGCSGFLNFVDAGKTYLVVTNNGTMVGIGGTISVGNTGTAHTYLRIDDSSDKTGRIANLSSTSFAFNSYGPAIEYKGAQLFDPGVVALNIFGGAGGNTFNVNSTANMEVGTFLNSGTGDDNVYVQSTSGTLSINGGNSDNADTVVIGAVTHSLAAINAPIMVTDSYGLADLTIDDASDSTRRTATLAASSIVGLAPAMISWTNVPGSGGAGVDNLYLDTGNANNTINVTGTGMYTPVAITLGANNQVNVLDTSSNVYLAAPAGLDYALLGNNDLTSSVGAQVGFSSTGAGTFRVTVNDSADKTARHVTLAATSLTGLTGGKIAFSGSAISAISVDGGLNDQFSVTGDPSAGKYILNGLASGSFSTITGPNANNIWVINGLDSGTLDGNVTFYSMKALYGGTQADDFVFDPGGSIVGQIVGGGGSDWVDYSALSTSVTVDLATLSGTDAGALYGIDNVRGGSGNDSLTGGPTGGILVGGGGNDTLVSGAGASVLVGGSGNDKLTAGASGDILIGGSTSYDANNGLLQSILSIWQSSSSYATRVSELRAGGSGGGYKLVFNATVLNDSSSNTLAGGAGQDWFFKGSHDTIVNMMSSEDVN